MDELCYMLATQRVAPNSPQWFNTGLHWAYGIDGPGQGHFYVDPFTGKLTQLEILLRASAAACLLHPGRAGRPRQRGRHHGPVGARSPPVQIRLGHRLNFSMLRGEGEKLSGGGRSSGLMSFLEDRRPRRRRHQVGRHDAPRRQDGHRRRRPPRYRGLHRLEGQRGAEGRLAGHRLQDRQAAHGRRHEGAAWPAKAPATTATTRRRTRP